MARKFGKKNVIKLSPVYFNLGLIGESGIGKTTLAKEFCEKLVGEDGYMIFNIGKEDGIDAIAGAIYEDIPDWTKFDEVTEDIIKNKNIDYKELKMIVYDTFDELVTITYPEVIRLHNKENPDKKTKSIKAAFGGFMGGEDKALELILDKMWRLKQVGVNMFILGHTKRRTMSDPITGTEYDMLTTNMSLRNFNAIKTKLHILGVASIDRNIEKTTVKQKVGKDKIVGKITDEARIITFRDDNFNVDSKSRFADIVPSIEFSTDNFIKALEDAIKKEHVKQKGAKPIDVAKKQQEKEIEHKIEENLKEIKSIDIDKNQELIEKIKTNLSTIDVIKMKEIMTEYNIESFGSPETIKTEALEKIVTLI